MVLGLVENLSQQPLADLRLRVTLLDVSGRALHTGTASPALPYLPPGERVPFQATLPKTGSPAEAEVQVLEAEPVEASDRLPRVRARLEEIRPTAEGALALLGTVETDAPAEALGVVLLGLDGSGQPMALSEPALAPDRLARGRAPFLALVSPEPVIRWRPFAVALPATGTTPALVLEPPDLLTDPQGNPFLLGTLRNDDPRPLRPRVTFGLRQGDRWLSVVSFQAAAPLLPGETRPFSASRFPAWPTRQAVDGVGVEAWLHAQPAPAPIPLSIEMERFEQVGSGLFLGGLVVNTRTSGAEEVAVLATLWGPGGRLWTAGEARVAARLAPGEAAEFLLRLPLPLGVDLRAAEFDLRALGTPP